MVQQTRLDSFLCELEDTLKEDRKNGKPIDSLWSFVEVVQRAANRATVGESKVLRTTHGKYVIAMPDGTIRADSHNPNGDWEKIIVVPTVGENVALRTSHGKYLTATADGRLLATSFDPFEEYGQFEFVASEGKDMFNIRTCHDKYLIAMPDGSVNAGSDNPEGTWERFEVFNLARDYICDRERLFAYLDGVISKGSYFESLTYVVNQWSLGGVICLKHHCCILAEAGGTCFLKFDFGRWGVGWSLSNSYPAHPKNTCLVETYNTRGSAQKVKRYLDTVQPFSWTANNCSSFSRGIIRELCAIDDAQSIDLWPTWTHCVANPPLKVPTGQAKPALPAAAPELVVPQERAISIDIEPRSDDETSDVPPEEDGIWGSLFSI
eukprot:TRINITY_DN72492_c0_g1_i1.p1 TRINITY_DN72492_c0_g1~~TRINITY_DN72492_c0_g1_i1.p1  ORF type:complete len:379 (+),score=32.69 TRINITY_DN72492_c0_g1_i1:58-1194(+)